MANPIQISMGASSSTSLAILSIWKYLGGFFSKIYQTGVLGTITGDTLHMANPIQINIGASSSPIFATVSIWEALGGTCE